MSTKGTLIDTQATRKVSVNSGAKTDGTSEVLPFNKDRISFSIYATAADQHVFLENGAGTLVLVAILPLGGNYYDNEYLGPVHVREGGTEGTTCAVSVVEL
jgi:hypothetical protein